MIETDVAETIELGDLIETIESGPFDADEEDSLAELAPALHRLANNRRFLCDLAIEELKRGCAGQLQRNHYTAQVIVLHASARHFLLRANFWPAEHDSVVANSGTDPFLYGYPHDHNFSFLTVGYLGPGYWSDYYEYDYERVIGVPGEKADLRFVERSRLEQGKILLYRRHLDIHRQLPPDELSVSLNVIATSDRNDHFDQYRFDLQRSQIAGVVNPSSLEALVLLAAHFGGNGRDLVDCFAARHPSERIRFAALRAQASAAGGLDGRIELYERAAADGTGYFAQMAAREARRIAANRAWIERAAA